MLYIRTEAGLKTGAGHVVRCLALAEELRGRGEESVFLVTSRETAGLVLQKGFRTVLLSESVAENAENLLRFLENEHAQKVLADFPGITARFTETLGGCLKLAYLGSREEFFPGLCLLVNYSNALNADFYAEAYDSGKTALLLGVRYAPLRKEFRAPDVAVRRSAEDILIAAGGSDEFDYAGRLAERFSARFPSNRFLVVSGELNRRNGSSERPASKEHGGAAVLKSPPDMAAVMRGCGAAVSASGTTLYELCACGTPTVCFSYTREQAKSGSRFGADGIADYAGDLSADFAGCAERIEESLSRLIRSEELYAERARKMQAYVDGLGCRRIADEIMGPNFGGDTEG